MADVDDRAAILAYHEATKHSRLRGEDPHFRAARGSPMGCRARCNASSAVVRERLGWVHRGRDLWLRFGQTEHQSVGLRQPRGQTDGTALPERTERRSARLEPWRTPAVDREYGCAHRFRSTSIRRRPSDDWPGLRTALEGGGDARPRRGDGRQWRRNDLGLSPASPLGRGFLTGTITSGRFDPRDFRSSNPRFTDEAIETNQEIVAVVRRVAERHGATPAQVALAWTLRRRDRGVRDDSPLTPRSSPVPPAGIEPATHGLGNRCSIH